MALATVLLSRHPLIMLKGAVLRADSDPNKQIPIPDVQINATNQLGSGQSVSDSSGFFRITLPKGFRRRQQVTVQFRRKDYQPLDLNDYVSDKIYIARMVPIQKQADPEGRHPVITVSNSRVRYLVTATTEADVGSTVKSFQVLNTGNVPCHNQPPCSPDGKWKAALDYTSLDAGPANQFRNARISCIAGPCPFTKV